MVAIAKFFLFASIATAALIPRDAAQILTDLKDINAKTNDLTSKTNAYTGGDSDQAVAIQNSSNALEESLDTATTNVKKSGVVTSSNAQTIIDYINNTLEPSVLKSINAIISKKSKFVADGYQDIVLQDLKNSKTNATTYADALITKTPSDKKSAATSAKNQVLADFQKGINAYS